MEEAQETGKWHDVPSMYDTGRNKSRESNSWPTAKRNKEKKKITTATTKQG